MWIHELYRKRRIKSKPFFTFLVFILPVVIIFMPYVIMRIDHLTSYDVATWLSLCFAGSWAFLGPFLIDRYFESLEDFQKNIICAAKNENNQSEDNNDVLIQQEIGDLIFIEKKHFKNRLWKIAVAWIGIIIIILLVFNKRLSDFAFYGFSDVYYWLALIYISFLLYLQSIGFSGIVMTFKIIRKTILKQTIMDNVLENSFQDGIKILGDFLLQTTMYFFTGIVFFPILIVFSKNQSLELTFAIITVMLIFITAILIFFLSSYYAIWQCALRRKNFLIDQFRRIYNAKMKLAMAPSTKVVTRQIVDELKILNINNHILKLEQINVTPINLSKTFVAVFTIIFPALFFIKDLAEFLTYIVGLFTK